MKVELIGDKGQSLLEILIALGIIALSVSSAVAVFFSGRSLLIDAQMENLALNITRQEYELTKAAAQINFANLTNSSSTSGDFIKETIVEPIDSYTKRVTNRVLWKTNPLRTQKVELNTILTDWRNVSQSGGDTGGGGLTGDWKRPITLGSIDLGAGNSATGLDVKNKIVYLSVHASDEKKPDFYIVNATDGRHPFIVSSINTGPGLNAVDVANNYAYVANQDINAQLQIIDVSNINNPVLVSSFKLNNVSGNGAVGQSVFYNNGKIYIGTKKATGPEFHIIDVSNPTNPLELGAFEVNADVNDIYVKNDIAYLATSDNEELILLDVSHPSDILKISGYNAPGDSEDGKSLWLVGNKLYLGRLIGGNHIEHHEFHIFDISTSTAILDLGSKDIAANVNGVLTRDYLAFLATDDPNKELQIWEISNPANINLWASFNFPQVATDIDYEDNFVYVSVRSNDALRIITSQ